MSLFQVEEVPRVLTRAALLLVLGCTSVPAIAGDNLLFTRLVGTQDRLWPEPAGVVVSAGKPHVAGEYVLFWARSAADATGDSVEGVWLWDGTAFRLVVDSSMPEVPLNGLNGQIYSVDETGLVAVNVEGYGMMGWKDGSLFPILLTGTEPPSGPPGASFSGFGDPIVRDGTIYFVAGIDGVPLEDRFQAYSWNANEGVVQFELGALQIQSVPVPADGGTYFEAYDDTNGFVLWFRGADGALTPYLQANTTPFPGGPPGSTWHFYFGQPGVLDNSLVLGGIDSTLAVAGLYRHSPDSIETVILRGEPDPVSGLPNQGFLAEYAADGDRVAFTTVWGLGELSLIVQQPDRSLVPIVATLGLGIDGVPVPFFSQTYGALSGNRLVFGAAQAEDAAVWMVDLAAPPPAPDPTALEVPTLDSQMLVLLGLALSGLGVLATKRRAAETGVRG